MDGRRAIERNRLALKAILAGLVAMVMSADGPHPEALAAGEPRRTLSRRLYRAVLRVLRPAESAARRLIIALAKGIVVTPTPDPSQQVGGEHGSAYAKSPSPLWGSGGRARQAARPGKGGGTHGEGRSTKITLPLFDRLRRTARRRPRLRGLPRICVPGCTERRPVPVHVPPSSDDPIDATRLSLRLDALARALDDLPTQAKRFARWQARQASSHRRRTRLWPLRLGPPPGRRTPNSRLPAHEVDDVLVSSHELAMEALERRDTS